MARTKREFVDSGEMRAVAEQLKRRYPELLFRVSLDQVYFAFCISEKAKNAASAVIRTSVSNPLPGMVTSKAYQIAIYRDDWEDWSDAKRHAVLLEQLMYVDEDGKYLKPNVQELYEFVKTWGPDWRNDEFLPDVLEEVVEFDRKPETPEEEDANYARMDPIVRKIVEEQKAKKQALADKAKKTGTNDVADADTEVETDGDEKQDTGDTIGNF